MVITNRLLWNNQLVLLSFRLEKEFEINAEDETCRVAHGYSIVKHEDQYYCLLEPESLEERMGQKNQFYNEIIHCHNLRLNCGEGQ